jgi:hypothetical protein
MKQYKTFSEFYPFYLQEHQNPTCRWLHFIGTSSVILLILAALITQKWLVLLAAPIAGYGFAWPGHYFFEKNRPATFKYPGFSLMADFVMYWHALTGKLPQKLNEAQDLKLKES